ncbi:alpha/beta fold hydrolase [Luethyella okanaganae]|uniref:Alpha/beta fold hydrolase n=1 Tax=Luethyella okanaganae TaxID=69372 RepID=A0ABW1VC52_9MICO
MPLYAESADGVLIAYDVHGGATAVGEHPPIVLIHGFASTAAVTWESTGWVRALTDAGRVVVTLDLRGHGRSDKPHRADEFAPTLLGADVRAVLDSAGADVVDVVAYSMGCRVASAFVELAQDRVRRVVLGGAGPVELFATWDLAEVRGLLLSDEPPMNPLVQAVLGAALAAGADRESMLACVEGVSGAPLIMPAGIPVLFVAGEEDPVTRGTQGLALDWGVDYVSIPGRDHINTLTARAFKDAVVGFLG